MSDRCLRCGADLPVQASFCPACGQPVASAAATERPADGPPAATPTPPVAAPPQPAPQAAAGPVGPPRPLSGRTAAIVFGGMALLFVVALVVVLSGGGGPKEPPTSTTIAVATGSPSNDPGTSTPNEPAPDGGSLRARLEQQVGPFRLQVVKDAELLGANERLQAVYKSASGVQVAIIVAAWPSADGAERSRQIWRQVLEEKGYKQVEEEPVRSTTGAELGTVSVHHAEDEFVVWTNANLSILAAGPIDQAKAFYDASRL